MGVSRDEAREVAITALLIATGLRVAAGAVQAYEELGREWTGSSLVGRFMAPVGSTMGLFVFGAAMIAALSPSGSVTPLMIRACRMTSAGVAVLGLVAVLNSLGFGVSPLTTRLWFSMINGFAAAVLGGAGWWTLKNLDPNR